VAGLVAADALPALVVVVVVVVGQEREPPRVLAGAGGAAAARLQPLVEALLAVHRRPGGVLDGVPLGARQSLAVQRAEDQTAPAVVHLSVEEALLQGDRLLSVAIEATAPLAVGFGAGHDDAGGLCRWLVE